MTSKKKSPHIAELLKSGWIVLAAFTGIIYWAARQDGSLMDIKENQTKISMLENRITVLEIGLDKLSVKIDGIKEDLLIIKNAVIK
jgi:hypothetical protein